MCKILAGFTLMVLLGSALSRQLPRFSDLDEEEQQLYRAAYDTPSYEEPYEEDDGKMDLMKDGLWAIKAKIKELKAFDKALAASMLSTKLKVKDLLKNHMGEIFKHHHKKKPSYEYQEPSYQPHYGHQYGEPQYGVASHSGSYGQQGGSYGSGSQYGSGQQYGSDYQQHGHDPYYGH